MFRRKFSRRVGHHRRGPRLHAAPIGSLNAANAYAKEKWNAWNVGGRKGNEPLRGTIPMVAVLEALAKDGKVVLLQHFRVDDAHDTKRTLEYSDEVNPMSKASITSLEEGAKKTRACDVKELELATANDCKTVSVLVENGWKRLGFARPYRRPLGDRGDDGRANDRGNCGVDQGHVRSNGIDGDEACFSENLLVAQEGTHERCAERGQRSFLCHRQHCCLFHVWGPAPGRRLGFSSDEESD